ncbi:MAG: hypothetical protein JWO53_1104 [Chlamydiia bacterium]|nr:hypothetical protein [Chlamydiia bacterium]
MKVSKVFKETNEIQRVITLRNSRNSRYHYQECILEGRIAIDQAYSKGWKIKSLFYSKDQPLSDWAKMHLQEERYDIAYEVTDALMGKIIDKAENSELIAIAETRSCPFLSYQPSTQDVVIVLDEPKSAGNVGMMIRSAVCFGATAVVLSGHAADEYDPKCIRASVGTFFSIPIYRVEGVSKFLEKIETIKAEREVAIIASGDKGAISLEEISCTQELLFLVLGNETRGVSAGYKLAADQFVHIPVAHEFTSLNIAAAGSIFLYEIFQKRKHLFFNK